MVSEFIATCYRMAAEGRWADLREYFALIRELLAAPRLVITVTKPTDKPA